jgi:hypothetical protein
MMVSQQVLEVQSRALVVPVSDPTPSALPAVAARKNLFLAFDANGNPIASQPGGASTPVSSAMAPVVSAATLVAGRTAFGLGTMATEGIGGGLADDGAGNARVTFTEVGDSIAQSVTSSFHLTRRVLFASVTYTLPLTSTLFGSFGFWVTTSAFSAIFAINAADSFNGMATGQSLVIGPGQTVFVQTNSSGTWYVDYGNQSGFNAAQNLGINASVASSALTISLKDRNGNDPSPTSPIITEFSLFGNNVSRSVATPLSITVPSGASLGTGNNLTNRIWVGLFDNAGTLVLGVYNSLNLPTPNNPSIISWDETAATTTVAISAGSTAAQNWYTQGGALSSRAIRILGFIESTQPTAGAWTVSPTKVQLFGPGIKKPGDIVQEVATSISSADTTTSATFVALANNRLSFTLQSAANIVRVESQARLSTSVNQSGANVQLSRGVVASTNLFGSAQTLILSTVTNNFLQAPCNLLGYDVPNTAGSITYAVQANIFGAATLTYGGSSIMVAKEIFI